MNFESLAKGAKVMGFWVWMGDAVFPAGRDGI